MIPVLIDCDPGIDDTLALIYLGALHHLGEIELVGVTTTAGNTTATQAAGNARWVLDQLGIDVPIAVPKLTAPSPVCITAPSAAAPSTAPTWREVL